MCFPADFIFQHSSDGLSWIDIPGTLQTDYQCADTTTQTFRFENIVSNQYFRLYATKLNADSYGNYYCQIAEMNMALDTTVGIKTSRQSADSELLQNYPNPFHHTTTISYSLQKTENVSLEIYDILGHKVAHLVEKIQEAGTHTIQWDASDQEDYKGGFYFVRLTMEGRTESRKMILLQ